MCMRANMLKVCANIRKCVQKNANPLKNSSQSWSRQPILGSWDRVALSRSPPLGPRKSHRSRSEGWPAILFRPGMEVECRAAQRQMV